MQSENKTYSAADIERYHAGQMPAEEMHALEKAALDDPFLADALEGYSHTATPVADLQSIREKLFGNEERKKRFLMPQWLKIAAILVVMAGGTWLAYSLIQTDNNSVAVQKEQPVETAEVPPLNRTTVADSINNETDLASTGLTDENLNAGNDQEKPEAKTKKPASATVIASGIPERQQLPPDIQQTEPVAVPAPLQLSAITRNTDSILQGRVASNNSDLARKEVASARVMESRNQDQRNRAMPNPENNNQVRNQDGYYRNSQVDTPIVTSAYGTQRGTIINDSTRHINVVMQPANDQLAEVVVLGNSQKSKEGMMRRVVIDSLEPAQGWASFDDYIASNLKEPEEIRIKKLPGGEVKLSFDVNGRGEPVNIAVVKSLCTKCDEEAIRLLKEGPKWKKNKNSKGRLTIMF